jgi:hypothetical protein
MADVQIAVNDIPDVQIAVNDMPDVQIAVIDQEDTQIALAVPGIQGEGVPGGGTTGQLLAKASGDDYDLEWIDAGAATGDITGVTAGTGLTGGGISGDVTLSLDASLDDLSDVDVTTTPPSDGEALVYDNATSTWVPGAAGATALDDLTDVDLQTSPPLDGEALVYDNATSTWVPGSAGATAAGSANQIQYNDGASGLAASADLTWDNTAKELGVGGDVVLEDGGTYATTLQMVTPTANRTISFPDATGTIALVAGSTGQVIYNNAGAQAGGNLSYDATAGTFGYGSGRSIVTQATNKSTGVTLNAPCGAITMNGAALSADTTVSFTLTNSSIAATDLLILNHVSGGTAGSYTLNAQAAAGSASINVRNITAGSLSEAIVIGFAVIKA